MANLYTVLSADEQDTIFDTIPLNGGSRERTIEKVYGNLVSYKNGLVKWKLSVESRDQNNKSVHTGDTTFTILPPQDTVKIFLTLDAHLSMLVANYYPIRDSVTRCVLRIDDGAKEIEIDTTFAKQSLLGDTVQLSYDYLSASTKGETHDISLEVYGDLWGIDTLLYMGDTTVTVYSGEDMHYNVFLRYVGPVELHGAATMMVSLGKVGTVKVNGILLQNGYGNTVTDIDGNEYHTVQIGEQVWMVENLRTTKYNDGTPIPYVPKSRESNGLPNTPAYFWYNNSSDPAEHAKWGALYNWDVVSPTNPKQIAPEGWHVPTDADWTVLTDYLGGTSVAGGKMKTTGTSDWYSPNTGATNESGFSALPGGSDLFDNQGYSTDWWSTTEYGKYDAVFNYGLYFTSEALNQFFNSKLCGFSVRLLRD